jgi:hypothetical protein
VPCQALQRKRDVLGALEAFSRILFETVPDDPIERGRLRDLQRRQIRGIFAQDRGHVLRRGLALERALTVTIS